MSKQLKSVEYASIGESGVFMTSKLTKAAPPKGDFGTPWGLIVRATETGRTARLIPWGEVLHHCEAALAVCPKMRRDLRAALDRLDAAEVPHAG